MSVCNSYQTDSYVYMGPVSNVNPNKTINHKVKMIQLTHVQKHLKHNIIETCIILKCKVLNMN